MFFLWIQLLCYPQQGENTHVERAQTTHKSDCLAMALRAENRIVALLAAGKQLGNWLAGYSDLQLGSEATGTEQAGNCRLRILAREQRPFIRECLGVFDKEATVAGPGESGDSDEEHTKILLAMAGARTLLFLAEVLSLTLPLSSLL